MGCVQVVKNQRPDFITHDYLGKAYREMPLKLERIVNDLYWRGKKVCILGGGESLKSTDAKSFEGKKTIGVNRTAELFDVNIWFFTDLSYYLKVTKQVLEKYAPGSQRKWNEFKGLRVMVSPVSPHRIGRDVYGVQRLLDSKITDDVSRGIYPGSNSGFAAIMLAIALGSRDIELYGFDMRVIESTHCHSGYPKQKEKDFKRKLKEYKKEMESFAPQFKKVGVKIVNKTPYSALGCFKEEL